MTNSGSTGFTVGIGIEGVISCVVYNEAPDFSSASVVVHKRWRVFTSDGSHDYANGAQPSGIRADLNLGGPGAAAPSPQPWDQERNGYDTDTDSPVTIDEDVTISPPGCELIQATIEDGSPEDSEPASGDGLDTANPAADRPLVSGGNEWTLTNVVECHSHLTLRKEVAHGPADPTSWTLDAFGPDGALPGPSGRSGSDGATRVEVTPRVAYQLAETADDEPEFLSHYLQEDVRSRPLSYPRSTGSWTCQVVGGPTPRMAYGNEGAISVPLGVHMECTAINNVALLNIQKVVQGGDAQPSDFTFTVAPLDPVQDGAHAHTVAGAGPPDGNTITVRPDQHYDITETGPDGYRLMPNLSFCLTAEAIISRADFALPPGATAACRFVNRALSELTVRKLDAGTGAPLAGATFDLVRDDGDGTYEPGVDPVAGTCTTEAEGRCTVDELDFGTYFWVETEAPQGYERPEGAVGGPIVINADNAGTELAVTDVHDSQILTDLSVRKVDGPGGNPLEGAVFQLYRDSDGTEPGDGPAADDEPVGPTCTTGEDGTCSMGDLPYGDYYWYEVTAPDGHDLPADRTSPLVTLGPDNAGTDIPAYLFTNPRQPGSVSVRKLDAADDAVLAGGTFALYLDDGDGAFGDDDTLAGQCTTNDDGTCAIGDLDFGTYFWVETGAPTGYDLPRDIVSEPIVIDSGNVGDVQERTFSDPRTQSRLAVRKLDAADDSPLAGARFELFRDTDGDGSPGHNEPDPDDTRAGACTTEPDGHCAVDRLDFGTYYWFEVGAPPGYTLPDDRTSAPITIDAGNAGTDLPITHFRDQRDEPNVPGTTPPPGPPGPAPPGGDIPGSLPTTGGIHWWLLPLGALTILVGATLAHRARGTAGRPRNSPAGGQGPDTHATRS
ncbi:SpaA isopeptide-forming pilin-related protein [Actinophytocola gossypii]|uniref:Uncharacterized protein n=1 Tax=Actinophytocola gossypii TaxID=2812003 RepID=A0ABT2J2D6_9PSEU|nr:SpaA isopeptide-forming pilin-related protein [Actinophytocola gossypii]MCT2581764.1 hypothetical protein [Actinophytocola gossypii]